jgi:hypothetical protein
MKQEPGSNLVSIGIDLTDFYLSVEWDILEVPAARNEEYYPCCEEPYSGIHMQKFSNISNFIMNKFVVLKSIIYFILIIFIIFGTM